MVVSKDSTRRLKVIFASLYSSESRPYSSATSERLVIWNDPNFSESVASNSRKSFSNDASRVNAVDAGVAGRLKISNSREEPCWGRGDDDETTVS